MDDHDLDRCSPLTGLRKSVYGAGNVRTPVRWVTMFFAIVAVIGIVLSLLNFTVGYYRIASAPAPTPQMLADCLAFHLVFGRLSACLFLLGAVGLILTFAFRRLARKAS